MPPIVARWRYATPEAMEKSKPVYKMPSGRFGREIMRRFAPWWIWSGVALTIAGIVAAFATADVRWAIVGLMVLMIMLPMALAFCYINHALCRECFVNILPHTVDVGDGMLVVTLMEKTDGADDVEAVPDYRELRRESFTTDQVTGWSVRDDAGYVELRDKMRGFLWVPLDMDNFDIIAKFARKSR